MHRFLPILTLSDGHLFCLQCARLAAQQLIGLSKTDLKCISSEEPCEFMFHIAEIERFLPEKEFKAYQILVTWTVTQIRYRAKKLEQQG